MALVAVLGLDFGRVDLLKPRLLIPPKTLKLRVKLLVRVPGVHVQTSWKHYHLWKASLCARGSRMARAVEQRWSASPAEECRAAA